MDAPRIETDAPRIETGPLILGDDWPGVFIRGDEALGYAHTLRTLLAGAETRATDLSESEIAAWTRVDQLATLLESCRATPVTAIGGVKGHA
jgi:hypothetical protein